jgi:hypothetical protein
MHLLNLGNDLFVYNPLEFIIDGLDVFSLDRVNPVHLIYMGLNVVSPGL